MGFGIMDTVMLWQAIIDHQHQSFYTSGRGTRPGVEFTYTVRPAAGPSGKHYDGQNIPGWSNELFIDRKEKSITRATVDKAYEKVLSLSRNQGVDVPAVSGPKKLGVFGASYIYPIFLELGIIGISTGKMQSAKNILYLNSGRAGNRNKSWV